MYVFLCPMKMESFTLPRLFSLLFLIISVLYQLLNLSEACFLGNPTLDLIHSAKKESLELTSTRGDLRKSKSLPNLNYLQESIPLTDGRTSAAFSTNLPKTPKTDSEGVPFNDLLSEERLNVQKDDRSKKKERVDFEKPTVTRPSESHSSHSYQPVNLLPPNENLQRPPTYPASYHPGIAPANNQGAQVFPSFSYPPSLTGLTPQSPFVLYGQPGILYTVIEGNPSDVIAPAILSNSHPHNYPVAPQYGYGAPSHIPPNNFYDPHLQAQHSSPFSAHSQGSYQTAHTIYAESQDSQNYFGPSSLPNYHTGDAPGLRNPNFYSNPLAQNSEFYSSFATTSQRVPPTKATTGTLFSIPIRERSSFKKLRGEFSRNNRHQAFKFKNGEKHSSSIREKNDSASKKSTGLDDFQNYNDLRSQNDAHNSRRRNDIDNSDIENKLKGYMVPNTTSTKVQSNM
ncbi:hypothetical protein BY996DRAFT_3381095 [Phakopsora pachyrhizi]|nr:hypothetical protein BY996DRAFT_3381095 [Phakopsora pachyrhizi]